MKARKDITLEELQKICYKHISHISGYCKKCPFLRKADKWYKFDTCMLNINQLPQMTNKELNEEIDETK